MSSVSEGSVTITPVEMYTRLQIDSSRVRDPKRVESSVLRWLERAARNQGRFINRPSLLLSTERDASLRQTFLYGFADSVPDSLPEWLRTVVVTPAEVRVD